MKTIAAILISLMLLLHVVARAASVVSTPQDALQAIKEALTERMGADAVHLFRFRLILPDGSYQPFSDFAQLRRWYPAAKEWTIGSITYDERGTEFESRIRSASDQPWLTIKGAYDKMVSLPVLKRNKYRGDSITEEDVDYKEISERLLRRHYLTEPEHLVGKQVSRSIQAFQPVTAREIEVRRVIHKDKLVPLVFKTPHMEVRTVGRAQEDASGGELVAAENVDSRKIVKGMATENGEILINYRDHLITQANKE